MALIDEKTVRDIDYVSRDFDSIKKDLMDYIRRHFPNEWQDFNEASGGMAILELIAYIGDTMSFYIDRQVNEAFVTRAVEEKNYIAAAQNLGYEPKTSTPAIVNVSVTATVPTSTSAQTMFTLKKGTRVITSFEPAVSFEILEDVDFSSTTNRTALANANGTSTLSVSSVSAAAGQSRTFVYTVGEPTEFMKIILPDPDVTEIVSVSGNDGSQWFEVDYLAQNTVFTGELNTTSTSADTPYVLRLKRVPKRYVVERETNNRSAVRFGSGILTQEDSEIIPNPEDFVLPPSLRGAVSGFLPNVIDSSNFLKTKTLGTAPRNIALDISYRYGGGVDTNVGSQTLTKFRDVSVEWATANLASISATTTENIVLSLAVSNSEQASGGKEVESLEEIRENAAAYFAAQGRAVTLQDYQVMAMSMPSKFGSVYRSLSRKDPSNNLGVEILTIAKNNDNQLSAADATLKNNIETYLKQYKSFSDSIKISDGKIVNIGMNFTVIPERDVNNNEALLAAMFFLRNQFDIANTNFNDNIVISEISAAIQSLPQVRGVPELSFFNRVNTVDGRVYSSVEYDIDANKVNNVIQFPEDVCWEVKFLSDDIIGRVVL